MLPPERLLSWPSLAGRVFDRAALIPVFVNRGKGFRQAILELSGPARNSRREPHFGDKPG